MKIRLDDLQAAAVRKHESLAAVAEVLEGRHARDLAAAVANKSALPETEWKARHAARRRLHAAADVLAALDEVAAEFSTSKPGAST